jgi:hypothetical protein
VQTSAQKTALARQFSKNKNKFYVKMFELVQFFCPDVCADFTPVNPALEDKQLSKGPNLFKVVEKQIFQI